MSVAQKLYEAGLITYMRTDSTNLSDDALGAAQLEIEDQYGKDYSNTRRFATKSKGAQEAHEAIRPTYFNKHIKSFKHNYIFQPECIAAIPPDKFRYLTKSKPFFLIISASSS